MSIFVGLLTFGFGGVAVFRSLVGRTSKKPPKSSEDTTQKTQQISEEKLQTSKQEPIKKHIVYNPTKEKFKELCSYIKTNYKEFKISSYKNIESLQKAGLPLHFAAEKKDLGLLTALVEAGANLEQQDSNGDTVFDLLMKDLISLNSGIETLKIKISTIEKQHLNKEELIKELEKLTEIQQKNNDSISYLVNKVRVSDQWVNILKSPSRHNLNITL